MPMPRHFSFSRYFIATTATSLLFAACQGDTTAPNESSGGGSRLAGQSPAAEPGDTARSAPATPAPSPSSDTGQTTPPAPPPATTIRLAVYVGIASPGADTLHSTPVANARVAVLSRTYSRSTGPDTLTVTETLVASGTTDALGNVSFGTLPAAGYRIEATVDGRPPANIQIAPPYSDEVSASIVFRPTS
jgi:hypothetical protein